MTTSLLTNLSNELNTFCQVGDSNLHGLLEGTHDILKDLKDIELSLEHEINDQDDTSKRPATEKISDLDVDKWYKQSIGSLKSYNTQINKFLKNILNDAKYNINLDEAYTYPLNLDGIPTKHLNDKAGQGIGQGPENSIHELGVTGEEMALRDMKIENQEELTKAIILHLLKIGQRDLVKDMLNEMGSNTSIEVDEELLDRFKLLDQIVVDITINHDLDKALDWLKNKSETSDSKSNKSFKEIEFKFHMLRFTLLLTGSNNDNDDKDDDLNLALAAHVYAKQYFPQFFKEYLLEISPLMTLLLFKGPKSDGTTDESSLLKDLMEMMKCSFNKDHELSSKTSNESNFVGEILKSFETVNDNQYLFQNLANEFISYYCKDLKLSNDSSLFQSILAGFINLPSFYKYNQIQRRLSRVHSITSETDIYNNSNNSNHDSNHSKLDPNNRSHSMMSSLIAPYSFDLPFQLSDANNFLFKYHPIFICPVSKEQLIPLTISETSVDLENRAKRPKLENNKESELIKTMQNPVVVLRYCQHVALRESVWQLSKKGSEVFKCHYCYKKHKLNEVNDAFFIDL